MSNYSPFNSLNIIKTEVLSMFTWDWGTVIKVATGVVVTIFTVIKVIKAEIKKLKDETNDKNKK